jgi:hypothetical protein
MAASTKTIAVVGAAAPNDLFRGVRDPKTARALDPSLQTFETWASRNAKAIPLG